METLRISGPPGRHRLIKVLVGEDGAENNCVDLCGLTEYEASALEESELVKRWHDCRMRAGHTVGDPSRYLTLEFRRDGIPVIFLRLPQNGVRGSVVLDLKFPADALKKAISVPGKIHGFIKKTKIKNRLNTTSM